MSVAPYSPRFVIAGALASLLVLAPAHGARAAALTSAADAAFLRQNAETAPLFHTEIDRARAEVEAMMQAGIDVPVPKDLAGGYTHLQHQRNYRAIHDAGLLYRITGDKRYADFVRDRLLAYADLYPTLGEHPSGRGEVGRLLATNLGEEDQKKERKGGHPGRLFWQILNDSVWLVESIQGYDAIRDTLSDRDRRKIDDNVFRKMAHFLADESPDNFNMIHNHATWAAAGVGMTGYVLRDRDLVEKALLGTDKSGKAGFLKNLDLLFSPDGYYAEGPYYQRYALMPFVVFARAIETNEPERKIFAYRDGILLKAIRTTIELTYDGFFFPLNDSLEDKGLNTEELYEGVAVGYALTNDPSLLSVAERQKRTVLTADGLRIARALAAGQQKPFPFPSQLLRDGAAGDQGALAILRSGSGPRDQTLVMKNTSQGMGHGHFDKLSYIFYDNGEEILTDYGSVRFLNILEKTGGTYLPENESWAKQTIAHNTLVVNEKSHFDSKLKLAETKAPQPIFFEAGDSTGIVSARMEGAYDDVVFDRTLAQLRHPDLAQPIVVDLLDAHGKSASTRYDLPLHYRGQIIHVGFPLQSYTTDRPVLGKANGYQHLWVDAEGSPSGDTGLVTWLENSRFYTYRFLPPAGAKTILAESGANDPNFNLRREPVLIQRVTGEAGATFVGVLEPHGKYDGGAETVSDEESAIQHLDRFSAAGADVIVLTLKTGHQIVLAVSHDPDPDRTHEVSGNGRTFEWRGFYARLDH